MLQRYLSTRLKHTTPSTVLLRVDPFLVVKWDDAMAYMRFATIDLMRWAPRIQFLVSNVLHGIRKECGPKDISGVHLRLEGDAGPWLARSSSYTNLTAIPTDDARARGWQLYLDRLIAYDMLAPGGPLYLSTGLVKSSTEDPYAAVLMGIITKDLQQVSASGSFSAETSLRSPRKVFMFIIYRKYFLDQSIQKNNHLILKTEALVNAPSANV